MLKEQNKLLGYLVGKEAGGRESTSSRLAWRGSSFKGAERLGGTGKG